MLALERSPRSWRHRTLEAAFLSVILGSSACDAPDGRPPGNDAGAVCLGAKCDASDDESGGDTDEDAGDAAKTDGAEDVLASLRDCYGRDDEIGQETLECLPSVVDDFEDVLPEDLEYAVMDAFDAPPQKQLCDIVRWTTALPERSERSVECRARADVIFLETVLSVVPFDDGPLNHIPTPRTRHAFAECIDEHGNDETAERMLDCAQDQVDQNLGVVRNNLVIEFVEGFDYTEPDAEAKADELLTRLLGPEREEIAAQCSEFAAGHPKPVVSSNLCRLEFEAQIFHAAESATRWERSD